MSQVKRLYKWLAREPEGAADEIISAALAHAESPHTEQLAGLLLERRHGGAWRGLIARYDRLPEASRARLSERPDLVRAGVSAVLKDPDERVRLNGFRLLEAEPLPQMSFMVADALRDESANVRHEAARALRRLAEYALTATGRTAAADREEVVKALAEGLRMFGRHQEPDVLEACLWHAKELGQRLWDALSDRHAHCGQAIARHMKDWNGPRLAGFLLLALARPAWRRVAMLVLGSWHTVNDCVAILRNTDLLANPLVRRGLQAIHKPRWLDAVDPTLKDLPSDVRGMMPYWVCHLGVGSEERLRLLTLWQASNLPDVHRAAVYSLASLNVPEANRVLAHVATRQCPTMQFAQWFVAGRRFLARYKNALGRGRASRARAGVAQAG
jgi:hypothetical protein